MIKSVYKIDMDLFEKSAIIMALDEMARQLQANEIYGDDRLADNIIDFIYRLNNIKVERVEVSE